MGHGLVAGLIFVTQCVDPADPILGFVPGLIDGLAALVDRVDVVANEAPGLPLDLASNVEVMSLGKERGVSRLSRGVAFEGAIARLTRKDTIGLLAHMCPIYLNLAWPIARSRGVPSLLWFAHPSETPSLWLAERLADGVITSLPGAYPRPGPKVRAIGQAIDPDAYPLAAPPPEREGLSMLALGRTSPAKGFETIVRAVDVARRRGLSASLRIVGPSSNEQEREHREQLAALIDRSGLEDAVSLEPGVPPEQVPALIRDVDLLVNAMVQGSADKVVFEAAAMGRPSMASNTAFAPLFAGLPMHLWFPQGDAESLADRLLAFVETSVEVKREAGEELRRRVLAEHSLNHWSRSVVDLLGELRGNVTHAR
jgi:glycosyltransferase involved in cell wall biosynthesis